MRTLVADTSVLIAWYLPERFSDTARRWQQDLLAGRIRLIVPSLHFWEFGNVLRTYVRRREIDSELAADIYAVHLEAPLEVRDPSPLPLLRQALEWDATVYDAVFLALAVELDVQLLTAERSTTPWVVMLADRIELVR